MSGFMNRELMEEADIVPAFGPVDIHTGANTGGWYPMGEFHKAEVVAQLAAGTASDEPTFNFQQAKDKNGTGAKALNVTRIRKKDGAAALPGTFTLVIQAAASSYTPSSASGNPAVYVVEIDGQSLDSYNGFDHIQCSVPAVNNSRIGVVSYLGYDARHPQVTLPADNG
jgi:hypothetical protein